MKLSIITINFNNALGLKKTIESVINQTSNNFEYIIIDGGSTDGSVEIIKKHADNLTYWVSENDNGIYHAMNKGIKQAEGEYCQFLNSGDYYVSLNVISKILPLLTIRGIFTGNLLKDLGNNRFYRDRGAAAQEVSMLTFYRSTMNHSSSFILTSLFSEYGLYDETLKIVSDWKWFMITVGLNGVPVHYADIDITVFDLHGISSLDNKLLRIERQQVIQNLLPLSVITDYQKFSEFNHYYEYFLVNPFFRFFFRLNRFFKRKIIRYHSIVKL